MCVIAVKPKGVAFPEEQYLENCFENNPDGAGFMTVIDRKVYIKKGLMSFKSFKKALNEARKITGDNVPYVMHFRIATQGFDKACTHPFPLTSNIGKMKRLSLTCDTGIAHNGIISLTSNGSKDYSDTMLFISEYMSLIADSPKWWQNKNKRQLIENLIAGSRIAVLDKTGHIELLGRTWVEHDGIIYSNESYAYQKWKPMDTNFEVSEDSMFCPLATNGDYGACDYCRHRYECYEEYLGKWA